MVGPDRLGIVAAMSRVIFDLGCNFEQIGSTIIGGHFAMTMLARCPDHVDPTTVGARLRSTGEELDLQVAVRFVDAPSAPVPTHVVSLEGADKPGIVYRIADALAGFEVNILSLDLRTGGSDGESTCSLDVSVSCPPEVDLERTLPPLSEELGTDVNVRSARGHRLR